MHHYVVEMGGFQPWMYCQRGDIEEGTHQFFQQPEHWSLLFLEHKGVVNVNNKPHSFAHGDVCFVAPGTKVQFLHYGPDTFTTTFTFALTPRAETVVVPAVASLGNAAEFRLEEVRRAYDWLRTSIMPGLAVCFNVLWSIARPMSQFRKSDVVILAESYISKNLSKPINIRAMSLDLGVSHNHLLRLFRAEHHCTIAEFIREQRAEAARQMIISSERPIKEVAARVGCSDLQYFNKLIRASTGMSPSKLREHARTRTRH